MGTTDSVEEPLIHTRVPDLEPLFRGKVRDIYQAGEGRLVLVATDRISAFDFVFPNGIPGKGKALTRVASFWFRFFQALRDGKSGPGGFRPAAPPPAEFDIHFISDDLKDCPPAFRADPATEAQLSGRVMLVEQVRPLPFEFIVRGHLDGSAWVEYQKSGTIWGRPAPAGLKRYDPLPELLFTPTSKAHTGHDLPVSWEEFETGVGRDHAERLRSLAIWLFQTAHEFLAPRGVILEDTKFEFGVRGGHDRPVLIDEALTPDSSRFLLRDEQGRLVPYDKQYIRDALLASGWNMTPPAPPLPEDIVAESARRYAHIAQLIVGDR
ncbi:MAG: phosphoribosylaminoimidazolesuccinocarboxamide synthase [Candidatus Sumerlaeia bacterium]